MSAVQQDSILTCIKVREHERQKGSSDRLKVKMEMNLNKRLAQIFREEPEFYPLYSQHAASLYAEISSLITLKGKSVYVDPSPRRCLFWRV